MLTDRLEHLRLLLLNTGGGEGFSKRILLLFPQRFLHLLLNATLWACAKVHFSGHLCLHLEVGALRLLKATILAVERHIVSLRPLLLLAFDETWALNNARVVLLDC